MVSSDVVLLLLLKQPCVWPWTPHLTIQINFLSSVSCEMVQLEVQAISCMAVTESHFFSVRHTLKRYFFLSSLSTPTVQWLCVQHTAKKSSFSNALSSLFAYQCTFNRIQFWMWLAALHLRLDVCTFEGHKHQVDGNAPFFQRTFQPLPTLSQI